MYMLLVAFLACFVLVAVKLSMIQIRDSAKLREIALDQYQSRETISPARGLILDRNLSILASNANEYTLIADPSVIAKPDSVAKILAQNLQMSEASVLAKLRTKGSRYVTLATKMPEASAAPFQNLKCYGVRLRCTPRRRYNFDGLASSVIGWTNIENLGQSGIEMGLEKELAGLPGYIVYQRDANGVRRPEVDYPHRDPVNGRSVVLTIDQSYQAIAEEELARGVEEQSALSGRCLIMQPRTGEILALANVPSVNPNKLGEFTSEQIAASKNRVVTDLYEPGSTFKVVAMSGALNENLHKPEDVLNAENGVWKFSPSQKPITDEHKRGTVTLRDAFINSSNIISAKLAEQLGAERFYKYARNFGFGIRTGIELPGEGHGNLRKPSEWDGLTLKYLAFGYGLSVTSLQIASAYAAVANDGVLMRPYIRKWLLDENRNIVDETVPQVIRRVISPGTARTMRSFMEGVVDSGTARAARIEGMRIGGKTGTSQRLVAKEYSSSSHTTSFVGFFPVEDPKVLILVIVDDPKKDHFGGSVAAPIFKEIALRVINSSPEFARSPEPLRMASAQASGMVPDVRGLHVNLARTLLASRGFTMDACGKGERVASQSPAEGTTQALRSPVKVTVASRPDDDGSGAATVPNVTGLSLRHAMARLKAARLEPSPVGNGVVREQLPRPGERVPRGTRCTLSAEPRYPITANFY
jgi:cell division protein FtsI (penicillin-binding protein 3)